MEGRSVRKYTDEEAVIAAAGGAALVAQAMVPGAWFILIGGIAGIAAAALMPEARA